MPGTPVVRIRFPDGEIEYRTTRGQLEVGTRINSRGVIWRVTGYDRHTVLVERADAPRAAPPIGETLPLPLGVEPPTVEILTVA